MIYHILGNGGFARELVASVKYQEKSDRAIDEFFHYEDDENSTAVDKLSANYSSGKIFMGVANPHLKKKWAEELEGHGITFQNQDKCHYGGTILDKAGCHVGGGSILCAGTVLTTDVQLGNHVLMNLNSTAGHGVRIGDYVTIAPGCHINGEVEIGECCEIGSGTVINPYVKLPPNGIIGSGSVVLKTPDLYAIFNEQNFGKTIESYVMVGNPAKVIKINGVRV